MYVMREPLKRAVKDHMQKARVDQITRSTVAVVTLIVGLNKRRHHPIEVPVNYAG